MQVLTADEWRARQQAHRARVGPWIDPRLDRRRLGRSHPVDDFLFDYYPYSTTRLATWHPGFGVALAGDAREFLDHDAYRSTEAGVTTGLDGLVERRSRLELAIRLLADTAAREGQYGCFGMHEWAMVYGLERDEVRHASQPLRLDPKAIVALVDDVGLRCTHIDAFRFFTAAAQPMNAHEPTRSTQHEWEQPGCLHANMDLYKYSMWFSPWVGSDLVADCFELARQAREIDMRAAPYDLSGLGYDPIPVESASGRREYAARQRGIADAATPLRARLLDQLTGLHSAMMRDGATHRWHEVADPGGPCDHGPDPTTAPIVPPMDVNEVGRQAIHGRGSARDRRGGGCSAGQAVEPVPLRCPR